ncbi:MAG: hypothetical protein ACOZAK_02455 [Patescibacteria group bacterium]
MTEEKSPIRIFAAEDQKTWQWTIEKAIEILEAELVVPIVADFDQAMILIKKLAQLKVDIAIIDGNLTAEEHDGEEGRTMIRAIRASAPAVKIIAYSSAPLSMKSEVADAYLDKVDYEKLAPLILNLLDKE